MESARSTNQTNRDAEHVRGPPRKYEKVIEQLEADVRGHIRVS